MNRVMVTVAALVLAAVACTQQQFQDVETRWEVPQADETLEVQAVNPDSVTVIRNIDEHPNLAIVCYDGVAFVTHTRQAPPLRVTEFDAGCPGAAAQ